ncbi:MAG: hypothetical protein K8R02_01720 [Anaerohalosphaeraceae bacterium]|nr:hypothetical protein [Anaerohalosphaeraceae bacterium]
MKVLNYDTVLKAALRDRPQKASDNICVRKKNSPSESIKVSVILLDWSCRERFIALDWLKCQDVPRDCYELIWVELYDRTAPEVIECADVFITCGQRGMYNKHIGYNAGLLNAAGHIIVICDSDAVYPPDFIRSVIIFFYPNEEVSAQPLVLMHYELRTSAIYPDNLAKTDELKDEKWNWWPLNPNAGACMSVRREDAIRFGGFDEHKSYSGYLCGPYDLGWRMVNAGIKEIWHDTSTVLWHFAHPDPVGVNGMAPSLRRMFENTYPHVDLHALTAVEAFSTGQLLPRKENLEIWKLRLSRRKIGTRFEGKYASMTGQRGFSRRRIFCLRIGLFVGILRAAIKTNMKQLLYPIIKKMLGKKVWGKVRTIKQQYLALKDVDPNNPRIVAVYEQLNIIAYQGFFYGLPQSLGKVDFRDSRQLENPLIIRAESIAMVKKQINLQLRNVGLSQ